MRPYFLIYSFVLLALTWYGVGLPRAFAEPLRHSTTLSSDERSTRTERKGQFTAEIRSDVPLAKLFQRLRTQFSGGWFGPYRVINSEPNTHTLLVTRDQIDNESWNNWATCHVDNVDMLDSLQDGTVTLQIALTPVQTITKASVSADFKGVYGLTPTSPTITVSCASTSLLEQELLSQIVATTQPLQHTSQS